MFERMLYAGWGDMDFNAHMRNTAFLDKAGDVRMMYFADKGFAAAEFARLKVGPVIMKDECEYFRELNLLEPVRVTLALSGLSQDGSRMVIRNEFFRPDGKLAARVTSTGGWLDLATRRLVTPPQGVLTALEGLARTEDFQALPSSLKGPA